MKRRIISLLLAVLMIVAVLAGCNKTESRTRGGGNNEDAYDSEEDKAIKEYVLDLSDGANYEGKTFTYLGGQEQNFPTKEEETGDIRSDALFNRQREIEEIYGVDFQNVYDDKGSDSVKETVINEVMAGGDSYDLVNGYVRSVGRPTLNAGVLMPMQNIDHINLDEEWWDEAAYSYELNDNLYFLLGPINVFHYLDAHIVIFNKSVTDMYGIVDADIYDSVKEGEWTIDKMFEFASNVPQNTSGNATYRYLEPTGRAFLYAAGYTITKLDEEGKPYVESKLPIEYSDLSDKLVPVFTDATQSAFVDSRKSEKWDTKYGVEASEYLFDDDRGLFMFPNTSAVEYLREYDVRFGILPMPKLNASQKNYYCLSESYGYGSTGAVYVPQTVRDVEMTGRIAESMAALSQIYVKEAYYNKLLKGQGTFDDESRDMLDIIFANKVYDMADLYCEGDIDNLGPFIQAIERGFKFDNSNFASEYYGNALVANMNIKMLLKTIEKSEQ